MYMHTYAQGAETGGSCKGAQQGGNGGGRPGSQELPATGSVAQHSQTMHSTQHTTAHRT